MDTRQRFPHGAKRFLTLRLRWLLERLRHPRLPPKSPPALVRAHREARASLDLDLPYYAAKHGGTYTLIPWDPFMEEAEDTLRQL